MSPRRSTADHLAYGDIIDGLDLLRSLPRSTAPGTKALDREGASILDFRQAESQFWVVDATPHKTSTHIEVATMNCGTWTVPRDAEVTVYGTVLRSALPETDKPDDEESTTPAEDPEALARAIKAHRAISPTIASAYGAEGIDEAAMRAALYAALTDKQTPDQQGFRETLSEAARDAGGTAARVATDSARAAAKRAGDFLMRQAFKDRTKG